LGKAYTYLRMDSNDWLKLCEETMAEMTECNQEALQWSSGTGSVRAKRNMMKRVQKAKESVAKLSAHLARMEKEPQSFGVGEGEIGRRKTRLAQLNTAVHNMDEVVQDRTSNAKSGLFEGHKKISVKETDQTALLNNQQLQATQKDKIADQDEKLDHIYDGVTKLKIMTQDINQELGLHENLLKDLDDAVEKVDNKMQGTERAVDYVDKKKGGCVPLLIILLLVMFMIFVGVTNFLSDLIHCPCK